MKRFTILAVCFIVCFLVARSSAEIYRDIGPLATLGDVKKLFPGATFKKMNPAWAQEKDAMYSIDGAGIRGTINIMFYDARPRNNQMMEEATDNNYKEFWRHMSEKSEDDSLIVLSVRWLPDVPFSVDEMITKYGKPEISDFRLFNEWTSRGIQASLSGDGKNVVGIDFTFTSQEMKDAWFAKFGVILPEPPPKEVKVKKRKKDRTDAGSGKNLQKPLPKWTTGKKRKNK